jgi:hypothetical protein
VYDWKKRPARCPTCSMSDRDDDQIIRRISRQT